MADWLLCGGFGHAAGSGPLTPHQTVVLVTAAVPQRLLSPLADMFGHGVRDAIDNDRS